MMMNNLNEEFIKNLLKEIGYTIEERTYVEEREAYNRRDYDKFPYKATIAYRELPDDRYKSGESLDKYYYKQSGLDYLDVYEKIFKKTLEKIVHERMKDDYKG